MANKTIKKTIAEEKEVITQLFKKYTDKEPEIYNDKRKTFRRIAFKSTVAYMRIWEMILAKLKETGIKGFKTYLYQPVPGTIVTCIKKNYPLTKYPQKKKSLKLQVC